MSKRTNKSKAIRNYLRKHPGQRPLQVAGALSRYGVTPAYVSQVKVKLRRADGNGRQTSRRPRSQPYDNLQSLEAAADFIRRCGGLQRAQTAFDLAERIVQAARPSSRSAR